MSDRCQPELDYLRGLKAKYGSHYLIKYFSFSLREMADKLGINRGDFTSILNGRNMPQKHQDKFIALFKEMQIEEKTKDFKESAIQLSIKELYQKTKNLLTILMFLSIILSMRDNTLFLKPTEKSFLEYIVEEWGNLAHSLRNTLSVAFVIIASSTLIFFTTLTHFFNNLRTRFSGAFFCLE